METKERIKVWVCIHDGKTTGICKRNKPKCKKTCAADWVERDKFQGIEKLWKQNRYGKCK